MLGGPAGSSPRRTGVHGVKRKVRRGSGPHFSQSKRERRPFYGKGDLLSPIFERKRDTGQVQYLSPNGG